MSRKQRENRRKTLGQIVEGILQLYIANPLVVWLGVVRPAFVLLTSHECCVEGGLKGRLVKTREGSTCIRGLELGSRHVPE